MRLCVAAAIVAALLLPLLGCGGPAAPLYDLLVGPSGLDGTYQVQPGAIIGVELPETPSTGYTWRCTWAPPEGLVLTSDSFLPGGAVPGAAGLRRLVLRATQPGPVVVNLQLGQWWSGGEREAPHQMTLFVLNF